MLNDKQFLELLESYLSGAATPAASAALMRLIKSGVYDDLLKQHIEDSIFLGWSSSEMNADKTRELLSRIINSEKQTAKLIPVTRPSKRFWLPVSAAAAALLVMIAGWWLLEQKPTSKEPLAKNETKLLKPAFNAKGKKYIRLQDGSTVLLNEGSHLEYPDVFKNKLREVTLTGEGYFDIRHDEKRPFIVHTGKVSTTVLGTAFNIKAYPGQKAITVTVTRGKVKVSNDQKIYGIITPNQSIAINTGNNTFRQETVNADALVEWKKQYLVLDDLTMEDAATLIQSRYHVTISFSNEKIKQCRISATFLNNENIDQVLKVVSGVINASYSIQPNDQVIINGIGCN